MAPVDPVSRTAAFRTVDPAVYPRVRAVMAVIEKSYEDAGRQLPEDLDPTNLC